MTIPADCVRVMLRADLGGVDVAVWGFHMQRVHHVGDTTDWPTDVNDIASAIAGFWAADMDHTYFSAALTMQSCDVYHLGTDGKTIDKGTAAFTGGDAWSGGAGTSMPWEVAAAVSLLGYDPSGFTPQARNKRGRFFLGPFGNNAVDDTTGAIGSSAHANLQTHLATFLGHVKSFELHDYGEAFRDSVQLGILSRRASIFTPVSHWYLDGKFDAQRRRENRQVPARSVQSL